MPTQPAHRKSSQDMPSPIHPDPDADIHLPTFTSFRGKDWPYYVAEEIYCGLIQELTLVEFGARIQVYSTFLRRLKGP